MNNRTVAYLMSALHRNAFSQATADHPGAPHDEGKTPMFRKMLIAGFIATAATFGAQAATGPMVVDESQSRSVVYDTPSANIVGSANATVSGNEQDHDYMTQRVLATQRPSAMYGFGVNQNWSIRVENNS
jgi:hypothetical protein